MWIGVTESSAAAAKHASICSLADLLDLCCIPEVFCAMLAH